MKKKDWNGLLLGLGLSLVGSGLWGATLSGSMQAQQLFLKGKKAFELRFDDEAGQYLTTLITKYPRAPQVPEARLMLAELEINLNQAIGQLKILAHEYQGRRVGEQALLQVASRYYLSKQYFSAARSYQKFIRQYPVLEREDRLMEDYDWLGNCYYYLKKYDRAQQTYQAILKQLPTSSWAPRALWGEGMIAMTQKKWKQSIRLFLMILNHYPAYSQMDLVYWELGQSYAAKNKINHAHAAYLTLVDRYPRSPLKSKAEVQLKMLEHLKPSLKNAPTPIQAIATPVPTTTPSQALLTQVVPTPTVWPQKEHYYLQAGVFKTLSFAQRLVKKLNHEKFSAVLVRFRMKASKIPFWKVLVGNYSSIRQAKQALHQFQRQTHVAAFVIKG
jgi:TolA-binding protein